MITFSITEARARFAELLSNAKENVVQVTDRNKPSVAVLSWQTYESMIETLELLSEPEMMQAIREGESDLEQNQTYDWDQVKKELGI